MAHSSIETLEPRWAPARLVAGPLPAEFGVNLPADVPELEGLVAVLGTIELPEFDMWTGGSAIALVAQWSRSTPDFAARAELIQGLDFHASLPGGEYLARSVIELSQDQREALEARFAARAESGETLSSASLTRLSRG